MSLVLGIRPTFFDHLSARYAANVYNNKPSGQMMRIPPTPSPPFQRCKKKMARFGFRKKELIIESGEGWFCFSFYSNQGCSYRRKSAAFRMSQTGGHSAGGWGGGGVLKKMFLSDSFGSMRQMISLRGKGAGKMVIIRYPRLLKGSYVWRIRKASK